MNIRAFIFAFMFASSSFAFSVEDHRLMTEIAFKELQACGAVPKNFEWQADGGLAASYVLIDANLDEDNYFKNGIKKLFKYSHFYNPFRSLKKEWQGRSHAGKAVAEYSEKFIKVSEGRSVLNLPRTSLVELGKIIHQVQDASSPPHVLWINHGMSDGFENKVSISKEDLAASKPNCSDVNLAGLKSASEVLRSSALGTMKELLQPVSFLELQKDGVEIVHSQPWMLAFFSHSEVYTQKVNQFLTDYNLLVPNFNVPTSDDAGDERWSTLSLDKGDYGMLSSDISNVTMSGDNFGKAKFTAKNKAYKVSSEEYKRLRVALMRQAILGTQRLMLWAGDK